MDKKCPRSFLLLVTFGHSSCARLPEPASRTLGSVACEQLQQSSCSKKCRDRRSTAGLSCGASRDRHPFEGSTRHSTGYVVERKTVTTRSSIRLHDEDNHLQPILCARLELMPVGFALGKELSDGPSIGSKIASDSSSLTSETSSTGAEFPAGST